MLAQASKYERYKNRSNGESSGQKQGARPRSVRGLACLDGASGLHPIGPGCGPPGTGCGAGDGSGLGAGSGTVGLGTCSGTVGLGAGSGTVGPGEGGGRGSVVMT